MPLSAKLPLAQQSQVLSMNSVISRGAMIDVAKNTLESSRRAVEMTEMSCSLAYRRVLHVRIIP